MGKIKIPGNNATAMLYLSTTINGLEDVAAGEIERLGAKIIRIMEGKLIYEADENFF